MVTVLAQLEDGVSVGTGVIFTDGRLYPHQLPRSWRAAGTAPITLDNGRSYEAQYVAGDMRKRPGGSEGGSDGPARRHLRGLRCQLTVGDKVYAIGNPLGVELRGTLTDGIVSAINRDVRVDGRTMTLIQTNAALNSGNSGGPLINAYGQVVGINTIKMSSAYSNIEGLGFAIPSASIQYLVNDLLTYGEVPAGAGPWACTVLQVGAQLEDDLWGMRGAWR